MIKLNPFNPFVQLACCLRIPMKLLAAFFCSVVLAFALPLALLACSAAPRVVPVVEEGLDILCDDVPVFIANPTEDAALVKVCAADLPRVDAALNAYAAKYAKGDAGAPAAPSTYSVQSTSGKVRAVIKGSSALAAAVTAALSAPVDAGK